MEYTLCVGDDVVHAIYAGAAERCIILGIFLISKAEVFWHSGCSISHDIDAIALIVLPLSLWGINAEVKLTIWIHATAETQMAGKSQSQTTRSHVAESLKL